MNKATTIPISELSIADKLLLMERLWSDLSCRPSDIPSPDWHGDILSSRQEAVRAGKTEFNEWADAKARLRERIQ